MAYTIESPSIKVDLADCLPHHATLKDGTAVVIDRLVDPHDVAVVHKLLNDVIEGGDTYPYEHQMTLEQFKAYYMSHDAFVMKEAAEPRRVIASTYIKPNFPGRSSHICNGGFLTVPEFRNKGAATVLAKLFPILGKKLGYQASFFNLVYATNPASIAIWENLGFTKTGVVPKAGRLKHFGYTDAFQYYYEFK